MAKIKEMREVREIALSDLIIGKGQVRVKDVGKEIEELAASIKVMGLLEPIVVCPSHEKGKFEILTGQRRFLAHKQLKKKTIMATVLEGNLSDEDAKAISLTENLIRRDLSLKELIDACTSLYKKYGSIKAVSEETGISAGLVNQYDAETPSATICQRRSWDQRHRCGRRDRCNRRDRRQRPESRYRRGVVACRSHRGRRAARAAPRRRHRSARICAELARVGEHDRGWAARIAGTTGDGGAQVRGGAGEGVDGRGGDRADAERGRRIGSRAEPAIRAVRADP